MLPEETSFFSHLKLSLTQYREEYITSLTPLTLRRLGGPVPFTTGRPAFTPFTAQERKKGTKLPPFTLSLLSLIQQFASHQPVALF